MCGRYAPGRDPRGLAGLFGVDRIDVVVHDDAEAASESDDRVAGGPSPDWNIASTKTVYAVLERTPGASRVPAPVGGPAKKT